MGDLEKGVQAEGLGEIGAQAGEHVVVEENIALNFLGQALDSAGVRQAELCASLLEGAKCVGDSLGYRVVAQEGERMT